VRSAGSFCELTEAASKALSANMVSSSITFKGVDKQLSTSLLK
jgi:hypothetical protein